MPVTIGTSHFCGAGLHLRSAAEAQPLPAVLLSGRGTPLGAPLPLQASPHTMGLRAPGSGKRHHTGRLTFCRLCC